jgi:hypothetical protein
MMNHRTLIIAGALVLSGCKADKTDKADKADKADDGDKAEPAASADAAPKAEAPVPKPAFVTEAGTQGTCEFVEFEGTGSERKAMFKITPPPGKEVSTVQTWEFYYDESGKYLERYPHATFLEGDRQALGYEGDQIPKDTAVVECVISRITFKDDTTWFNENLVPDDADRPMGGVPEADLQARSGEKVEVEVVDAKAGKVKLKNVADKAVKSVSVDLLYRLPDGKTANRSDWFEVAIAPGATVEHDVKLGDQPVPEFKTVEGYAPRVRFEDGSEFSNANLKSFYR